MVVQFSRLGRGRERLRTTNPVMQRAQSAAAGPSPPSLFSFWLFLRETTGRRLDVSAPEDYSSLYALRPSIPALPERCTLT